MCVGRGARRWQRWGDGVARPKRRRSARAGFADVSVVAEVRVGVRRGRCVPVRLGPGERRDWQRPWHRRARVRGGFAASRRPRARPRTGEGDGLETPHRQGSFRGVEEEGGGAGGGAQGLGAAEKVRRPPNEPNPARVSRTVRRVGRAASVARVDRTPETPSFADSPPSRAPPREPPPSLTPPLPPRDISTSSGDWTRTLGRS